MNHHAEREQLLAQLLAGDRSVDDPDIVSRLDADPELRAELAALQGLADRVDGAGRRERRLVHQALAAPVADLPRVDVGSIVARLAGVQGDHPAGPQQLRAARTRRRWVGYGVVAAAALLLAYLVFRPSAASDDDRTLSGEPLVLLAPKEQGDGRLLLTWTSTMPLARFEALIYDPALGADKPLAERPETQEEQTAWTLEPVLASQLSSGCRLRVIANYAGRSIVRERALR